MSQKILMITESAYPEDTRIKHEAETMQKAGYAVSVIALNEKKARFTETVNGVRVYRLPMVTIFSKSSPHQSSWQRLLFRLTSAIGYVFEYIYFTVASFVLSAYICARNGFDIVHIHNPPNTLVLVAGLYKLLGKKFVFDHHDLAPELYLSKYGVGKDILYRMLMLEEQLCLRVADMVIATNESYKAIDIQRGRIDPHKVIVVRNGPDLEKFTRVPADGHLKRSGRHILVYVGIMGPQDGVDYLLRSLHQLVYDLKQKDVFCIVIGTGDALDDLKAMARELMLDEYVWFTGFIPRSDLLRYLSTADVCLDPNPSSPLNDVSTWIKVMEYMAMAKPVVSFDLKETRHSARQAAVYVRPNDTTRYAQAVAALLDDPGRREQMGRYGRKRVEDKLAWKYSAMALVDGYRRFDEDACLEFGPLSEQTNC